MLEHLEPQEVFRWFEALCAIPHGSGNTSAVADWCVQFARERGLEYNRDSADNVILIKPASPGYAGAEPVILQGHLDMVCAAAPDCPRDLTRQGPEVRTDGKFVWAEKTTLGGDDGVAVAMALAALDDKTLPHPRLEVVLTADEEVGMLGADALDTRLLRGRRMLNLDSEAEGVLTVGCAGGSIARCTLPVSREPFVGQRWRIAVSGLRGGHSGEEIHTGRGNACMLLGRVLREVQRETALRLLLVQGGEKDNAIPTEARAELAVSDGAAVQRSVERLSAVLRAEYVAADGGVTVTAEAAADAACGEDDRRPMNEASTARVVDFLLCAPNGVQETEPGMGNFPRTSLNLGILRTEPTAVTAHFCLRSSVGTQKELLSERLTALTERLDGSVALSGDYPAWEVRQNSPLRELAAQVYREQTGREATVAVIHGGVECGILSAKLPELDCVSLGPNLTDIHTPRERLDVASLARTWALVREILRRCR